MNNSARPVKRLNDRPFTPRRCPFGGSLTSTLCVFFLHRFLLYRFFPVQPEIFFENFHFACDVKEEEQRQHQQQALLGFS